MRNHELETWVLDILDKVTKGQPVEDSRVEIKTKWIGEEEAARRIAGHANAARGESILWIIGANERGNSVEGVDKKELSTWWSKVQSCFSELPPAMLDKNVHYEDKVVVAMLFDTEGAPFVVKNPKFGHTKGEIEREVPWREGTAIRSAKRADLLKLLSPLQSLPNFEVCGGFLRAEIDINDKPNLRWELRINLYNETLSDDRIVIPFHRCFVKFKIPAVINWMEMKEIKIIPPSYYDKNFSRTIERTQDEVIINGPGRLFLIAWLSTELIQFNSSMDAYLSVSMEPVGTDRKVSLGVHMEGTQPNKNEAGRWIVG